MQNFQNINFSIKRLRKKFSSLKESLFLYALIHNFIEQIIEGDELYTKVNSNKSVLESEGQTVMLV